MGNFSHKVRKASGNILNYESFMGDISKDLHRYAKDAVRKAGKHVKSKLKQKSTQKFGASSNITKGIGSKFLKTTSIVGVGPPAHAAHLIEFGTDDRFQKSGHPTGHIAPDPFVFPTYAEESPAVVAILSKEWF